MPAIALPGWLVRQWTARFPRHAKVATRVGGIDTTRWTLELLRRIEWRRFGALCGAYFEALGRRSEAGGAATHAGFGFRLEAEGAGAASLVQCTAWSAGALGVPAVRALRAAMTGGAVGDGVL